MVQTELERISRDPDTKLALDLYERFGKKSLNAASLEEFLDSLPTEDAAPERAKLEKMLAQPFAPVDVDLSTRAGQLVWAAGLGYLFQNSPPNTTRTTPLWKALTRNPQLSNSLQTAARYIDSSTTNRDVTMDWGTPGSWFWTDREKNHINIDMFHTLLLGFGKDPAPGLKGIAHATAAIMHEVGHSQLTIRYTDAMNDLKKREDELIAQGNSRLENYKGPEDTRKPKLTQDEYKEIVRIRQEWQLRASLHNAVEDDTVNRFAANQGKDLPYDISESLNIVNTILQGAGASLMNSEHGKQPEALKVDAKTQEIIDAQEGLARLQKAVFTAFYTTNGLFDTSDTETWKKIGVDPAEITSADHKDFKGLMDLCIGAKGAANLQPATKDSWLLKNIFAKSVQTYADKRSKIIDQIWDQYAAPYAKVLIDAAEQQAENGMNDKQQQSQDGKEGDPDEDQQGNGKGSPQDQQQNEGDPSESGEGEGEGSPEQQEQQNASENGKGKGKEDPKNADDPSPSNGDGAGGQQQPDQEDDQDPSSSKGDDKDQKQDQSKGEGEEQSSSGGGGKSEDDQPKPENADDPSPSDGGGPGEDGQGQESQEDVEDAPSDGGGKGKDQQDDKEKSEDQSPSDGDGGEGQQDDQSPSSGGSGGEGQQDDQSPSNGGGGSGGGEGQQGDQKNADDPSPAPPQGGCGHSPGNNESSDVDVEDVGEMPVQGRSSATPEQANKDKHKDDKENLPIDAKTLRDLVLDAKKQEKKNNPDSGDDGDDQSQPAQQPGNSTPGSSTTGGTQKGIDLASLAECDWTQYKTQINKLGPVIGHVAKDLSFIHEKQTQYVRAMSNENEQLPHGGNLIKRLDMPKHISTAQKKATGQHIDKEDLKKWKKDTVTPEPTSVELWILGDGSGSMTWDLPDGSGSCIASAVQSMAILYEAGKRADFETYVGMWGNHDLEMLAAPGDSDQKVGDQFERAKNGLGSGTQLSSCFNQAIQCSAKQSTDAKGKPKRFAGMTHFLILSDGGLNGGDMAPTVEMMNKLFKYGPAVSVDVAILGESGTTEMDMVVQAVKQANPKAAIDILHAESANDIPTILAKRVKKRFMKATKDVQAIPDVKKREAFGTVVKKIKQAGLG